MTDTSIKDLARAAKNKAQGRNPEYTSPAGEIGMFALSLGLVAVVAVVGTLVLEQVERRFGLASAD